MRATFVGVVFAAAAAVSASGIAVSSIDKGDNDGARAPTHDEIRARQKLGRAIASPDGQFFLYEWLRPYNWVRDTDWLPAETAERMQAWLYKVDVTYSDTTSEYIFYPDPGSGYWLGDLSPDATKVAFYELDNDEDKLKAGVWDLIDEKMTWFDTPPDASRLDEPAAWLSDTEVVYAVKSGAAGLVRADVLTGKTTPCADCKSLLAQAKAEARKQKGESDTKTATASVDANGSTRSVAGGGAAGVKVDPVDKPTPDAKLIARSHRGDLEVFARDTADVLALIYRKGEREPETIFENMKK